MYTFYADDTYAKSEKGDEANRLHFFGGFLIPKSEEPFLLEIMRDEKSKYTHPNLPIKWNFKDTGVREKFEQFDRGAEYKQMLAKSNDWRREIIKNSLKLNYTITCATIESYSSDPKAIRKSKPELLKFSLENILMRVGIDVKQTNLETFIVLDWPPEGNPQPFVQAFYRLFHTGKSSAGSSLMCGKLSECRFYHTLLFAKCNHSPMLQFSDLLIGLIKDYIECRLSDRQNLFATEMFEMIRPKIRNLKGKILNYGIITSTGNTAFQSRLREIIRDR